MTTMKRGIACLFGLGMIVALGSIQLRAADDIVGPLRKQWEATRGLIVGMAEAIPESKYDYKPTPEVRSFREQLTHLVSENYTFMGFVSGEKGPDRAKIDALKTHDEIVQALKESYDSGAKVLAALTDEKAVEMVTIRGQQAPRWTGALLNIVDNMDHYGNLVVYVRLNGMVPPRSVRPAAPPAQK